MGELVVGPARRGGRLSKTFPYNRKEEAHDFMGLERRLKCNHVSSESCCLHLASFSPPLLTHISLQHQLVFLINISGLLSTGICVLQFVSHLIAEFQRHRKF